MGLSAPPPVPPLETTSHLSGAINSHSVLGISTHTLLTVGGVAFLAWVAYRGLFSK